MKQTTHLWLNWKNWDHKALLNTAKTLCGVEPYEATTQEEAGNKDDYRHMVSMRIDNVNCKACLNHPRLSLYQLADVEL